MRFQLFLLLLAAPFVFCGANHAAEEEAALRFELVIEAPADLAKSLRANLDLARWQGYGDLAPDLLQALVADARDQAQELVAIEGYFAARVEAGIEGAGRERTVRITVEPGEPARVSTVRIRYVEDPEPEIAARVRAGWPLQPGQIFRQGAWQAAKQQALESLAQTRYAGASIVNSRATVDPQTGTADLELELDQGPSYVFGPVSVKGLAKYADSIVLNLAPFTGGEPYSKEKVDLYVRRLTATGYFASAQVVVDTTAARAATVPVQVAVIESPTRRLDAGIGYSTDARLRSSISWRDVNVRDSGWRLRGELRLESQLQGVTAGLDFPARSDGWADGIEGGATRSDVQNLTTRGVVASFTRKALEERRQPSYGLSYYFEQQSPAGAPTEIARALFGRYEFVRRTTDDLLFPREGSIAALRVGAAIPGASSQNFGRAVGQLAYYLPLSRRDGLALRAEAGAVLARDASGIPQALLFRAGGDTSVRGYAYQALGVNKGSAIVGGRYYALTSAEYTHWVSPAWGLAAFVDAGNAVDRVGDLRLALGYGAGLRVRSPVGPFRFDVARGRDSGELRLHFSVGVAF